MDSLVIIAICLFLYFLPALVAGKRFHKNINAIFALNLFLGWTVLGWVVSLVWALGAQDEHVKQTNPPMDPPRPKTTTGIASETPLPTIQFPGDASPEEPIRNPENHPGPIEQDWVVKARQELAAARKNK